MNYYEAEAQAFFQDTVDINVSEILTPFTDLLPDRARVLDAGCGSGRDTLFFKQQGFRVDAFDASFALCGLASEYSGVQVTRQRLEDFDYPYLFDGIWCNAVMLHIEPGHMTNHVLARLRDRLKPPTKGNWLMSPRPGGALFVSWKLGRHEQRTEGKRTFTDMHEVELEILFDRLRMDVVKMWITDDYRPDNDTKWINAIARRTE